MNRILYRILRFLSFLRFVFFRRFTDAGRMVLAGLAATALLGADTYKNMAHQAFSLLFFLLVLALGFSRLRLPRLTSVSRVLPRIATAGAAFTYSIKVKAERKRGGDIILFEDFGDPRPDFDEFSRSQTKKWRFWAGMTGYANWKRATEVKKQVEPAPIEMNLQGSRNELEVRTELLPLKRGYLRFAGVTVLQSDPLGLYRSTLKFAAAQSVLILPKQYALQGVRLAGGRKYHQGGVSLASQVGDSDEFVALRDYRSGDPLKKIHWKSWARTGKPVVKEYADEFFTRHALVLDTFADEGGIVFEEAVAVAASLVSNVELGDSLLDLMFVGTEAFCFTTGRSVGHTEKMLEILACARACTDKTFTSLDELVVGRAAILSSCICVLLAWDEPRQEFVRRLRALRIPVKVLLLTEPGGGAPDPGAMRDVPSLFHVLEIGKIEEALRRI
jgi:uncharacterized protein (DUF58 family)